MPRSINHLKRRRDLMKGKVSIVLMVGLVVSLCALTTWAQDEEKKAQAYFVVDVLVKPSMISKYEAAVKLMVSLYSQHNTPYPFYAFLADDMKYHFLSPVENLADVDKMFKFDMELEKKMGEEKMKEIEELGAGAYEYAHTYMIYHRPDLSYTPQNPRLKSQEANFRHLIYYYIRPDKEKEFQEILKKFVSQPKLKSINDGYDIYFGGIGMNTPACLIALSGKSAADFETHYEKIWGILGDEAMMMVQELVGMARGLDIKTAWFRPDLSYIPEEK
jgi:hypothetical protein